MCQMHGLDLYALKKNNNKFKGFFGLSTGSWFLNGSYMEYFLIRKHTGLGSYIELLIVPLRDD